MNSVYSSSSSFSGTVSRYSAAGNSPLTADAPASASLETPNATPPATTSAPTAIPTISPVRLLRGGGPCGNPKGGGPC
ncbi:hypothetical protein [Streptomyces laculatispora]|uniref:hypothetical protein n=1 Tax=Streptomyces laculatispora TaxID=887464 RepID=UPI003515D5E2